MTSELDTLLDPLETGPRRPQGGPDSWLRDWCWTKRESRCLMPIQQHEAKMSDSLFFLGCRSLGALKAAHQAIQNYEQSVAESGKTVGTSLIKYSTELAEPDEAPSKSGSSDTIYRAFTWAPLGNSYSKMFQIWSALKPEEYLSVDKLASRLGLSVGQVQARFSKLSARIRRVASDEELAPHPRTALGIMVDIAYSPQGTSHRLTNDGRAAVQRYLKQ